MSSKARRPRRPRLCPTCTAVLGREVRHAVRRLCSLVQAQRRFDRTAHRRAYDRERKRAQARARMATP